MKLNLPTKLIAVLAAGSLALVGCSGDASDKAESASSSVSSAASEASTSVEKEADKATDKDKDKDTTKKATLADWDGSYRSITSWLDEPEIIKGIEDLATKNGKNADETKATITKDFGTGFEGLVINGDKITFVKDAANLDNPTEKPVEYKYLESKDDSHNGKNFTWYIFEAQGSSEYKYVVLLPKHGEETLEHFHGRFGNDKDKLLSDSNFPIFIDPSSATDAQIMEEIEEHLG